MIEFDLQRFDDEGQDTSAEQTTETAQAEEKEPLPEELNGLPEDYARDVLAEWESSQKAEQEQPAEQPAEEPATETKRGAVPYERFKEKVDEANQLKAQLAEYQRRAAQQPQPAPQPQPALPPQPQMKVTPEIAQKINAAIDAEAKLMCNFTKEEFEDLEFADDNDPKFIQWKQAKAIAQNYVFSEIRRMQAEQRQRAEQFLTNHQSAVQAYNTFAQKEFAEPDIKEIQNFAANEFFTQLPPAEQKVIAESYSRVEKQIASPAELYAVKTYYERAKAAYRNQKSGAVKQQQSARKAPNLPRTDQLKGTVTPGTTQLSATDIEKLLQVDFTTLDKKTQKLMLGLS